MFFVLGISPYIISNPRVYVVVMVMYVNCCSEKKLNISLYTHTSDSLYLSVVELVIFRANLMNFCLCEVLTCKLYGTQ